jgi:hypothetical protein
MTYAAAKHRFTQPKNSNWTPRPLNRTGDLAAWKRKMKRACPNPIQGEIVFLDRSYMETSGETVYERVGYKAIKVLSSGEAIWQRGQVNRIHKDEFNHWS